MKTIVLNIFLCFIAALAFSQDIRKGETVYFQNDSKNESAADVAEELRSKLGGYFNFTNDKNKADHIMKLHIETGRGITLTSWGGKSILCSVTMISKNGEIIWESDNFKASPNGSNGFNSARAAACKLARSIEKNFRK